VSRRAYDPAFRDLIPALPTAQDLSTLEKVQEARGWMRSALFQPPPDRDDVKSEDRSVPGPQGAPDVPVRIYRPKAAASAPRPAVFEIHGGGFMMGDLAMMDPWCQRVAAELDAIVVSVDYRLAPEHPFPAGLEDCYASLVWTAAEAKERAVVRISPISASSTWRRRS